jgi:hypothetical protein
LVCAPLRLRHSDGLSPLLRGRKRIAGLSSTNCVPYLRPHCGLGVRRYSGGNRWLNEGRCLHCDEIRSVGDNLRHHLLWRSDRRLRSGGSSGALLRMRLCIARRGGPSARVYRPARTACCQCLGGARDLRRRGQYHLATNPDRGAVAPGERYWHCHE